jgi:hypothetical protein
MSIGPIDIEFVVKGDVDEQLRKVSDTVKGDSKAMSEQMDSLGKSAGSAINNNQEYVKSLRDMPGPLGQATRGIEGMTRAAMRFIATPVGAVIAAIAAALMALTSWFRRTEEGQNALAKASGYFKQILDNLLDVVDKVGKWLFKAFSDPKEALNDLVDFLKGQVIYRFEALGKMASAIGKMFTKDWKEGLTEMGNAMLQFQLGVDDAGKKLATWGTEMAENARKRAEIEDKLFKLRIEERKINEEIAASEAKIAELRFKGRDETLPEKERLAYMKEANKLIEDNYQKEIDLATRRRDLVKEQKELSNSNIEDNEEVSRLNVEILNLQARQANEQRMLMRDMNTLTRAVGEGAVNGIQSIEKELKELQNALLTAEESQKRAIAERIIELQKELELRVKIADEALRATRNSIYGTDIIPEKAKPIKVEIDKEQSALKKAVRETSLEVEKLNQKIKENSDKVKKWLSEWSDEGIKKFMAYSSQILDITDHITEKYKEQLRLTEQQSEHLKGALRITGGIADIVSGNYIQGAAKIIDSAIGLFVKIPEEMNVQFEHLQDNVEKVLRSIEIAGQAMINIGNTDVIKAIGVVNQQLKQVAKSARDLNSELEGTSYGPNRRGGTSVYYGQITRDVANLSVEIEKLTTRLLEGNLSDAQRKSIEAVLETYNALLAQIDDITRQLTGTTVNELAESLSEAFLVGIDAAEEWGRAVDDIIKHVIIQQLTSEMIKGPVQEAIDKLIKDTEGGLTTEEAERFKTSIENLAETVGPAFNEARKALESIGVDLGGGVSTSSGMTGAIRALTEETGGMIYGQMMGIRYDIKAIITRMERQDEDIVQRQLVYMSEIAANTRYNQKLNSIDDRLAEMNLYLKNI